MAADASRITLEIAGLQAGHFWQRKQLVWALGTGGLALILFFLAGFQLFPQALAVRTRSEAAKKTANATSQRAALITGLTPEDRENFVRISQTLPQSKEPLLVLKSIEAIARESQVSVGVFDSNPGLISTAAAVANRAASAQKNNQFVRISVELNGTFSQISRALELLESSAPIMEVTELSLSPESGASSEQSLTNLRYTALLQVTSYFLPPQSASNRPALPLTPPQQRTLDLLKTWQTRLSVTPTSLSDYERLNLFTTELLPGESAASNQPDASPEPKTTTPTETIPDTAPTPLPESPEQ